MSEIHTAQLDLDQYRDPQLDGENKFEFDVFDYFENHGYPIDDILEAHSTVHVKPEEENTAHTVLKIQTLSKPLELADASADTHYMWVCDGKGFQYHYGVDLENKRITEWGTCDHIKAVAKEERASSDPDQTSL